MILLSNLFSQNLSASDKEAFCYLPTENNVSYASILELPTTQTTAILKYGDDPLQVGELWLPSSHALSSALAANGYAVWAIEYRRTGDIGGGWPGSYDDIKAGVEFTQNLDDYSLDLSKVIILGHSAGGLLALLAGSDDDLVKDADISAVIGLAAITNILEYAKGSNDYQAAVPKFIGGLPADNQQNYLAANPAIKKLHPETFLLHGSEDEIVPLEQATQSGIKSQVIQGAGHFDMIHPATLSFQALLKKLQTKYKRAL